MKDERGFSILEAMVASMIMIIGIGGLMALFAVAAAKNAGQGNQATRCTEFAQDKMEQLLGLTYTPTTTDTTSQVVGSSTICSGCTGYIGAQGFGLAAGGGADPSVTTGTASPGYVDYVNQFDLTNPDGISGALKCAGCNFNAQYMREWKISAPSNGVITITVFVKALFTADVAQGLAPSTTLIAMKQQY